MKALRRFAQTDPSGALVALNALAGVVAAAMGHPEFSPVFVAVAALVLGLRSQVTPTAKVDKALTAVALNVASNLTATTAGTAGEITGPAAKIVDDALQSVSGAVGR